MKRFVLFVLVCLLLSCNEKPVIVNESTGSLNRIIVVMEEGLWKGEVGEVLSETLTASVDGLVREEPSFVLNHMNPSGFQGLAQKARNYIVVRKGEKSAIDFSQDKYANPQLGAVIVGKSNKNLIDIIQANAEQIRKSFRESELQFKQSQMKLAPLNDQKIRQALGIEITIPTAYRYAMTEEDFFWLRRDVKDGTMDIILYEVPREVIQRDTSVVKDIIAMRDSVGTARIPTNKDRPFITEKAFAPYLNKAQIDGYFAYETKGLWEVKGAFMSGPFINYAIYDKQDDNWLIAEGYVFAPSAEHRDLMFELEAILRSIDFVEQ